MRLLSLLSLLGVVLFVAGCGSEAQPVAPPEAPPRPLTAAERIAAFDPLAARSDTTGVDSTLLAQALTMADSLPNLYALVVTRHGEILAEHYKNGYRWTRAANIKSGSKSVLSAITGAALTAGVLDSVQQPVAPLLAREVERLNEPDSLLFAITIEDLLTMRAGLETTSGRNYGAWVSSRRWVRDALDRPFVDEPGGRMIYSTGTTHLLSAALTSAAGTSTLALGRRYLNDALGTRLPPWPTDPQGIYFGGNDMLLSPQALFRFGELYRAGGLYTDADGLVQRALPADWVRASWTPRTRSPWSGYHYGYGWWMKLVGPHPVYFAWGYGGQYVFVVPSLSMTVVVLSDPWARSGRRSHTPLVHRMLDTLLIPAAIRGAEPVAATD
ncbi:MAG: serine hydrolase [Bacteroidota bacterium]